VCRFAAVGMKCQRPHEYLGVGIFVTKPVVYLSNITQHICIVMYVYVFFAQRALSKRAFARHFYASFISETIERFSVELGFRGVWIGNLILVLNCPLYTLFYSKLKLKFITFLKRALSTK
jgi:hypothetical protein